MKARSIQNQLCQYLLQQLNTRYLFCGAIRAKTLIYQKLITFPEDLFGAKVQGCSRLLALSIGHIYREARSYQDLLLENPYTRHSRPRTLFSDMI